VTHYQHEDRADRDGYQEQTPPEDIEDVADQVAYPRRDVLPLPEDRPGGGGHERDVKAGWNQEPPQDAEPKP
jgi:hypothetical protein